MLPCFHEFSSQLPSKLPAAPSATRAAAASLGTKELLSLSNGKPSRSSPFGLTKVFGGASGGHGWRRRRLRQLSTGWRKTLLNSQVLFQTMSGEETFLECNFAFVRPRKTFSTIAIAIAALSKLYPLWRNDAIFAWYCMVPLHLLSDCWSLRIFIYPDFFS